MNRMQEERDRLALECSQGQAEQRRLQQDLEQQAASAERQVETMAAVSDQAFKDLRTEHQNALSQVDREHQEAKQAAKAALISSEV